MSKQRPWGWIVWRAMAEPEIERCKPKDGDYVLCEPLYTVPPARKPLTDDEIKKVMTEFENDIEPGHVFWRQIARAIERAHGIGDD